MKPSTTKPQTVMVLRHSGTHLILPIVKRLTGKPVYRPKGQDCLTCVPNGPVVVFVRNPRNWIVSSYRWKRGSDLSDARLANFMTRVKDGAEMNALQFAHAWAKRWMVHPGAMQMRMEDLKDREKGIAILESLRGFLKAGGNPAEVYDSVYGGGTYTGRHSNWKEWFGPLSRATWRANRGREIEELMGYPNE